VGHARLTTRPTIYPGHAGLVCAAIFSICDGLPLNLAFPRLFGRDNW